MKIPKILCIDVGNSTISMAIASNGKIDRGLRLQTRKGITSDELFVAARIGLGLEKGELNKVVIGSVVPEVEPELLRFSQELLLAPCIFIDYKMVPLKVSYDDPKELGIDRLLGAYGAITYFSPPLITIDMGTATTFNCVKRGMEFAGGLILPGLKTSLDSLTEQGSRLPKVFPIVAPSSILAKNTTDAMTGGIIYGYTSLVEGLVMRLKKERGLEDAVIVMSGGLAHLIMNHLSIPFHYVPDLVVNGIVALSTHITP